MDERIIRLYDLLESQIDETERHLDVLQKSNGASARDRASDARTLASLAKTLDFLRKLEKEWNKKEIVNSRFETGRDGEYTNRKIPSLEELYSRLTRIRATGSQDGISKKPDNG